MSGSGRSILYVIMSLQSMSRGRGLDRGHCRDTIQLDDAVSTISEEYLLEFTSEYSIPEDLHPELPGTEDTVVDFPEGKVGIYTNNSFFNAKMDLFNLISAPNPAKVKTRTRPRAAHEVPLLTATANRVIDMDTTGASGSFGTLQLYREITNGFCERRPSAPYSREWCRDEKSVSGCSISSTPAALGALTVAKSVSDLDPLLYAKLQPYPEQDIAHSVLTCSLLYIPTEDVATTEVNIQFSVGSPESGRSTSVPSVVRSSSSIYQPGWGVTNFCRLDTPTACQDTLDHIAPPGYFSELRHLPNADFLSQYNINLARQVAMGSQLRLREEEIKKLDQEVKSLRATETEVHGLRNQTKNLETLLEAEADMKKVTEAKNAKLTKELESLHVWFSDLQVNNNQLYQQVSNLQAQITGEEETKAAFEQFKKYKDDRVDQRCAKMDARLDKLSVDFDEELYPHMLTAIAGHRWVIGHGLPLAVMKCAESAELRQVFANVVSVRIAKGMSEGLKYGIEHGKADQDLVDVEAYDPEANDKLVKALQDLKDLEYLMVDQLERQKDAPMELIMASLHLEGDTGEDAPQRISNLRPSSSQLKIPVYPEGLGILLADAATQTEAADKEEEPHLRLHRSISLPQ
ncbi:hypothetical protein Tco_1078029, partial [Tanacetum coccineum]